VAKAIVRGISRQEYIIIPGLEGRFLYGLTGLLGPGTYHVMDWLIGRAQKKVARKEN
jgi:hypothetical protein